MAAPERTPASGPRYPAFSDRAGDLCLCVYCMDRLYLFDRREVVDRYRRVYRPEKLYGFIHWPAVRALPHRYGEYGLFHGAVHRTMPRLGSAARGAARSKGGRRGLLSTDLLIPDC